MNIAIVDILHNPSQMCLKICVFTSDSTVGFTLNKLKNIFNCSFYHQVLVLVVPGSLVGQLLAHDDDEEGTLNAQLTYTIVSQNPPTSSNAFAIDAASGRIQALRSLQRKKQQVYNLNVRVSDPGNTHTHCMCTM